MTTATATFPTDTQPDVDIPYLKKVIYSCMLGNALEWYDFALYGYFATIIGKLFFPSTSDFASLMATFGVFAAGFLMRPLGGIIFGYIGDKIGRRNAMMWSIYIMAIPTAAIGALPTFESIGFFAPLLLTIIRLLQGISMGGGFTGAMIMVVENSDTRRRGYFGSWVVFSLLIGVLLGSAIAMLTTHMLNDEQLYSWGWRVPFLLSIFGGYIGTYMKKYLHETEEFEEEHKDSSPSIPIMALLKDNIRTIIYVIGIELTLSIGFYLIVAFINNYLTAMVGMSHGNALLLNTVSIIAMGIMIPISGRLSDIHGRKKVLIAGSVGFALFTYPLFQFLGASPLIYPLMAQVCLALLMGLFFAPIPATLVELFPSKIRYTAMSVAHSLSMTIFGGTAPFMATWLIATTGDETSPAIYLAVAALVSAICLLKLKDNRGNCLKQ